MVSICRSCLVAKNVRAHVAIRRAATPLLRLPSPALRQVAAAIKDRLQRFGHEIGSSLVGGETMQGKDIMNLQLYSSYLKSEVPG